MTTTNRKKKNMKKNTKSAIKCISVDCDNAIFSPNKNYEGVLQSFNDECIIVTDDAGNKKTVSLSAKRFFTGNKLSVDGEFLPQYAYFELVK